MRAALIAIALVMGLGGTANAGRGAVLITSGDEILFIRDLSVDAGRIVGYGKLGYHYDYVGVFWIDLWRSGGEFCVYSGDTYVPLEDDELESLGGASVPWKYHLPPGLIILAAMAIFGAMTRARRRLTLVFAVAGAMALVAVLFFFKGLDWEFMIPGGLALYFAISAYFAVKKQREQEALELAMTPTSMRMSAQQIATEASTTSGEHRAQRPSQPPSQSQAGAVTSPAQQIAAVGTPAPVRPSQPLVVERPSGQQASVPMRADDSVDGPKLLR